MKILAMSDIHGSHDVYSAIPCLIQKHGPDVVILAGDLLGAPAEFDTIEEAQEEDAQIIFETLEPVKIPVLYIMGNDDMIQLKPPRPNWSNLHDARIEFGAFNIVGYQYSLPFMGGIFEKPEEEIRKDLGLLGPLMDDRTALVTHSPAFGILNLGILDRTRGECGDCGGRQKQTRPSTHPRPYPSLLRPKRQTLQYRGWW